MKTFKIYTVANTFSIYTVKAKNKTEAEHKFWNGNFENHTTDNKRKNEDEEIIKITTNKCHKQK